MMKKNYWLLTTILVCFGLIPTSHAVLMNSLENVSGLNSSGFSIWQSNSGQDGQDGLDLSWNPGSMGTRTEAYAIRSLDSSLLSRDSRPLPEVGDVYDFALYAYNESGSQLNFQNYVKLDLKQELEGDTLNHDYLFKMDIGKDGSYEFNQVITADQMRSGFTTEAWTQQLDAGFAGEYAIGSLEVVPEPVTIGLFGIGVIFAFGVNRFRKYFEK